MGKLPYSASIHRSSCPSPAKRDCPECRSPMEASVSCRGQDTPASEEEQQRRPNRARRLLVDAVRQRARRGRPVRRLRSATLDRRVVTCVTRTWETTMGDRDGPGPTRGPPGHVQQLPGITAVSAGQAQIRRIPGPIGRSRPTPGNNEIQQLSGFAAMARPALEPGTPRFSVVRPKASNNGETAGKTRGFDLLCAGCGRRLNTGPPAPV
jgi:hypothetical protein